MRNFASNTTILFKRNRHIFAVSQGHLHNVMNVKVLLCQLCTALVTPWTVAFQAPLTMKSSMQEYWKRLSFPSPGDLPNPGIEPTSPAWQAASLPSEPPGKLL